MIEKLAAIQHEIWRHWMRYLFSCCNKLDNGDYIIPKEKANHWKRQIGLKYFRLTEKEKESDRSQAHKIWKFLMEED
jgi:hypothetical protein